MRAKTNTNTQAELLAALLNTRGTAEGVAMATHGHLMGGWVCHCTGCTAVKAVNAIIKNVEGAK